jgi:hypothetical protein
MGGRPECAGDAGRIYLEKRRDKLASARDSDRSDCEGKKGRSGRELLE